MRERGGEETKGEGVMYRICGVELRMMWIGRIEGGEGRHTSTSDGYLMAAKVRVQGKRGEESTVIMASCG